MVPAVLPPQVLYVTNGRVIAHLVLRTSSFWVTAAAALSGLLQILSPAATGEPDKVLLLLDLLMLLRLLRLLRLVNILRALYFGRALFRCVTERTPG